uniref:DNA ligase ATP-dependent N-terminal domain-containing protein n=1 Tax=Timema cristinae TaxID=61476 RepID=A0A7R9DFM4_TIMCR|nr:unnamed protein product [Timema cristinae]
MTASTRFYVCYCHSWIGNEGHMVSRNTIWPKVYIRILCLPKDGRDAEKLLNFRAPKSAGAQSGDFADVAYWVLKSRCPEGSKLTVQQVNAHLDNIAIKHALHEPRGVDDELIALLRAMSASDQKWLIRMLLKDMKLGIGHSKILETFHPDARELYDVTNNLAKVRGFILGIGV